ncbi:phosphotransferase [Nonomuraea fuscirosea]|uniref:phosphotransferase family protein n=2 Tax=Nonomuraea fuscirosea TaxID=1291556 RepID=UPI00343735D9
MDSGTRPGSWRGPWLVQYALMQTHDVRIDGELVRKRFIDGKPGGAEREWRALRLLAEHAPGLAPSPVEYGADLVVMSRVEGTPIFLLPVVPEQELVEAVDRLHGAVPRRVLDQVPGRLWPVERIRDQLLAWAGRWQPKNALADQAVREGARWLGGWEPGERGVRPVFGAGDGNTANFLWDGGRVRIVDFEESGRSDRATEVAEMAEHVSCWVHGGGSEVGFEVDSAEERRLLECRRLFALMWVFLLKDEGPRNPPGTFMRAVGRALERLG